MSFTDSGYIKCQLRVVISYGLENIEEKIEVVKQILENTGAFTNDTQEFLIVIGASGNSYQGFKGYNITKSNLENLIKCEEL